MEREIVVLVKVTVRTDGVIAHPGEEREPGAAPDGNVMIQLVQQLGIADDLSGVFYVRTGEVVTTPDGRVLHLTEPWRITDVKFA
jgi:hypothetical protein